MKDTQSALRSSAIKVGYLRSMLHMRDYMCRGKVDSATVRFGRLVHMAILEPDRLPAIWQGKIKRGKEYDAWLLEQAPGVEISTPDEWCEVQNCRAAVMRNARAKELLAGTLKEVSIQHTNDKLGLCTARIDAWRKGVLIDLKTTVRVDARSVAGVFAKMAYHLQFGWYSWILEQAKQDKGPDCYSILVEQEPPYDVAVARLSNFDVMAGIVESVKVAEKYRLCEASGVWPGCQPEEMTIELPEWAYKDTGIVPDEADEIGGL